MNQEREERLEEQLIRRILVGLDDSRSSRTALEIAAQLAARFEAELLGLFVQDINLLRFAQLPFAQEMDLLSAAGRRMDLQRIKRELRVQAKRLRRSFTLIIRSSQIRGSFRVARGAVVPTLIQVAEESEADMIILGKAGRSPSRHRQLGSTSRALVREGTSLTLILQNGACLDNPIVVVYDGTEEAERALAMATSLIDGEPGIPLTIFLLVDQEEEVTELQRRAVSWLRRRKVPARFRALTPAQAKRLARVLPTEECGTLVLPACISLFQEEAIQVLLDRMDVPVLLVR